MGLLFLFRVRIQHITLTAMAEKGTKRWVQLAQALTEEFEGETEGAFLVLCIDCDCCRVFTHPRDH